jgi:hypothetical protein
MNSDCIDEKANPLITPEMIVRAIRSTIKSHRPRWRELERQALRLAAGHPEVMNACVAYARKVIGGRWDDLEPVIVQAFVSNPVAGTEVVSCRHEVDVIADHIWDYIEVIQGRWTAWEEEILKAAAKNTDLLGTCVEYGKLRIQGRWPDLEPLLLRAILAAYESFVPAPWDEILPEWMFVYEYVEMTQAPWPELEDAILGHGCLPTYGVTYAIIRKSRWPAFEKRMLVLDYSKPLDQQISDISWYATELCEGRPWPEAETFFMNECRAASPRLAAGAAVDYSKKVIKSGWTDGEELLIGFPAELSRYAQEVLKHPLPEHLHSEMAMRSFATPDDPHIRDYFKWCDEWAAARGGTP